MHLVPIMTGGGSALCRPRATSAADADADAYAMFAAGRRAAGKESPAGCSGSSHHSGSPASNQQRTTCEAMMLQLYSRAELVVGIAP